jgi:hypothetical protein
LLRRPHMHLPSLSTATRGLSSKPSPITPRCFPLLLHLLCSPMHRAAPPPSAVVDEQPSRVPQSSPLTGVFLHECCHTQSAVHHKSRPSASTSTSSTTTALIPVRHDRRLREHHPAPENLDVHSNVSLDRSSGLPPAYTSTRTSPSWTTLGELPSVLFSLPIGPPLSLRAVVPFPDPPRRRQSS